MLMILFSVVQLVIWSGDMGDRLVWYVYVWVDRKLLLIEPHKPLMYDSCIPQLVLGNDAWASYCRYTLRSSTCMYIVYVGMSAPKHCTVGVVCCTYSPLCCARVYAR